ncbi:MULTISPECIES: recombinase family protein [unclassified Cytobacillus]|uniref:recombinase family protein n=1 Tax=unclassified Cytobacillus TaxID=2675268 RepID=UPI0030F4E4D4
MGRPFGLDVDIYLRKSRKDIEEERNNPGSNDTLSKHRNQLLALCKNEQHKIQEIHEEIVTGENISERPKIQNLLRRIENGMIEAVVVIDMDRLGRGDMLDQGLLDRAFRYSGTKLITLNDYYDPDDESWELVFSIKSLVARQELKAITRRLQNGRVNSTKEGKSITKKPPYGYLRDDKLRLYPDPETEWVVKKIFHMMCNGHGRNFIAEELDKIGVSPPNKDRNFWSPSTITAIVKNEVYLGHIIWGKVKYKKKNGKYQKKKLPREEWNITYNAHEPLITQEVFEKANIAHTGRYRPSTVSSRKLSNPLAGILKCGVCGKTMWNQPRKNRPSSSLRCASPSCKGVQKGASFNLVEKNLLEILKQYLKDFNVLEDKKEDILSLELIKEYEKALTSKSKEHDNLIQQKNNQHDLLEKGIYSIDTFIERQNHLSKKIKTIETEKQVICSEIQVLKQQHDKKEKVIPKLINLIDTYYELDNAEKKNQLLKSVLEKVTYIRTLEMTKKDEFILNVYLKI